MKPDIVVYKDGKAQTVLDTKWKNLDGQTPSANDLRQLYAYHKFYKTDWVGIIYPSEIGLPRKGVYLDEQNAKNASCDLIGVDIERGIIDEHLPTN